MMTAWMPAASAARSARCNRASLGARATGIPFDALPKSQVLLKITELDPEKQFIALNYVKAVAPAVA